MKTPTRKCAAKASPNKGKKPKTVDEASPLKSSVSPRSINTPNTRASKGSISMDKSAKSAAPLVEEDNRSSDKSRGWFFTFAGRFAFLLFIALHAFMKAFVPWAEHNLYSFFALHLHTWALHFYSFFALHVLLHARTLKFWLFYVQILEM